MPIFNQIRLSTGQREVKCDDEGARWKREGLHCFSPCSAERLYINQLTIGEVAHSSCIRVTVGKRLSVVDDGGLFVADSERLFDVDSRRLFFANALFVADRKKSFDGNDRRLSREDSEDTFFVHSMTFFNVKNRGRSLACSAGLSFAYSAGLLLADRRLFVVDKGRILNADSEGLVVVDRKKLFDVDNRSLFLVDSRTIFDVDNRSLFFADSEGLIVVDRKTLFDVNNGRLFLAGSDGLLLA
jgi:hypothetical protein